MPKNLSLNEVAKNLGRCRPERVRIAILAGVLPALDRGPGHVGRRPRFLIAESDALAWVCGGCRVMGS